MSYAYLPPDEGKRWELPARRRRLHWVSENQVPDSDPRILEQAIEAWARRSMILQTFRAVAMKRVIEKGPCVVRRLVIENSNQTDNLVQVLVDEEVAWENRVSPKSRLDVQGTTFTAQRSFVVQVEHVDHLVVQAYHDEGVLEVGYSREEVESEESEADPRVGKLLDAMDLKS